MAADSKDMDIGRHSGKGAGKSKNPPGERRRGGRTAERLSAHGGSGSHDEFVAFAVYVYNLYRRIVFEVLAKLGYVYVHAPGVEIVVVVPNGL